MMQCPTCYGRAFTVEETVRQQIIIACSDDGTYTETEDPRWLEVSGWEHLQCLGCQTDVVQDEAAECFELFQQGQVCCTGCDTYVPVATAQRRPGGGYVGACCAHMRIPA